MAAPKTVNIMHQPASSPGDMEVDAGQWPAVPATGASFAMPPSTPPGTTIPGHVPMGGAQGRTQRP
eukprot:5210394-Prorocentrum_lima.AAC.1